MPRWIRSKAELRAALRARRDELDIPNANIEQITDMPDGYFSKMTAPRPIRGISGRMLQDILDGLALGIVAVAFTEDLDQVEKMRPRWTKRRRPPTKGRLDRSE